MKNKFLPYKGHSLPIFPIGMDEVPFITIPVGDMTTFVITRLYK
jgi:hypothetical protein